MKANGMKSRRVKSVGHSSECVLVDGHRRLVLAGIFFICLGSNANEQGIDYSALTSVFPRGLHFTVSSYMSTVR